MKKKTKHIEEHRKAFEIEVAPSEVKARKDELFQRLGRTATVPGFRAGKAPRDLLEKHYGERVTHEVIEDLISDSYHKAVEEEGFIPLGLPEISDVKLNDASALFFKAEFTIRPKIELKHYKGLKLIRKKFQVKEENVQKSIKTLQESNARFKNAENRPVQLGDYAVCDSEIFIDGKLFGKKRENIWMPIEEKSPPASWATKWRAGYIPNLSAGLIGANPNDEKEIESVLPQDFPNKDQAGKKALFKIKVKEIKEKNLPQIDDEFAKDLGYNNLAAMTESVRKILEHQAERQQRQDLENQTIERLLETADFNVPNPLVESQLKYLMEEEKEKFLKQGLKEDAIKPKEKELAEQLRPIALKQVKVMFILDEIAHLEKISVPKEELEEAFEGLARQYNQTKAEIEKYYKDNDLVTNLCADLRNGKTMDLLIKEAKIEEGPSSPGK